MPSKIFFTSALIAVMVAAFVWGSGCQREEVRCAICYMPIPKETRAVIRVEGGSSKTVCDARCPLTFQGYLQTEGSPLFADNPGMAAVSYPRARHKSRVTLIFPIKLTVPKQLSTHPDPESE